MLPSRFEPVPNMHTLHRINRVRYLEHASLVESTVVPIHKKRDKTGCSNYRSILLSTSNKILSSSSMLITHADEIIGDHQCGFRCNGSMTDQIFNIRHILQKKWKYNGT
jgi:hypothetical protein